MIINHGPPSHDMILQVLPQNTNIEPEHHPFEKENHLNQTSIIPEVHCSSDVITVLVFRVESSWEPALKSFEQWKNPWLVIGILINHDKGPY